MHPPLLHLDGAKGSLNHAIPMQPKQNYYVSRVKGKPWRGKSCSHASVMLALGLFMCLVFHLTKAHQLLRKEFGLAGLPPDFGRHELQLHLQDTPKQGQAATGDLDAQIGLAACQDDLADSRAELKSGHDHVIAALAGCKEELEGITKDFEKQVKEKLDALFHSDKMLFQTFLESSWKPEVYVPIVADKGLLMAAGAGQLAVNAFVNLFVIRHHLKSTIPATLVYWGPYAQDRINSATQQFFKEHIPDIDIVDASTLPYPKYMRRLFSRIPEGFNGFKVKIAALYAAPYNQVLGLDSDSMPLVDPLLLFDLPAYKQAGNLFWPDRFCINQNVASAYDLYVGLGMPSFPNETYTTESGQFLINRQQHQTVLEWLLFLNVHEEFTFYCAFGDKDTFRAAFFLANKTEQFNQVEIPVSSALYRLNSKDKWAARGFLQHHPDNEGILFLHRTSQNKYPYDTGQPTKLLVSHMLLEPSCVWNAEFWHNDAPEMDSLQKANKMPSITTSSSSKYNISDLAPALRTSNFSSKDGMAPTILEVPASSHLTEAQAAADRAFQFLTNSRHSNHELFFRPSLHVSLHQLFDPSHILH